MPARLRVTLRKSPISYTAQARGTVRALGLHRIGQTQPVDIYNLSAAGTVEDYVLDLLDRKLNMFELVIGEMDMILGELTEEQDFEGLLFDAWTRAHDETETRAEMDKLGDALAAARARYQKARDYDDALFGQDFTAE